MLLSALRQRESAASIPMSPSSWAPLQPRLYPTPLGCQRTATWAPVLYSNSPRAVHSCFTHGGVSLSTLRSRSVPPSPFPAVSTSLEPFHEVSDNRHVTEKSDCSTPLLKESPLSLLASRVKFSPLYTGPHSLTSSNCGALNAPQSNPT